MANIPLKSIKFPDLDDTYTVPSNAGELPYNKSATYPDDTVGKALQNIGDSSAPAIIETAQGSIASFDDGADNIPVKDLVAEIVPLQSGSGDPSPSNVRAISGWTEANITVCQKNLLNTDRTSGTFDNITYTKNSDGTVSLSGSSGASPVWVTMSLENFYQDAKDLGLPLDVPCIISGGVSGSIRFGFRCRYASSNILDSGSGASATFTNDDEYIPAIYIAPNTTTNITLQPMVRLSTADSTFEKYHGETHTISFASAGTVYGGRLDVTSGVLTVTDANIASYNGEALPSTWISDRDVYAIGTTPTTGAQVVYKLATPQTYQLTPTEVKTLLKNNNIWADTGDVTVEYVADTKTFIENLVNA